MNWFQKFFTNPNVHALGAALAPGLMTAFPQYALAIGTVGTLAGVVAAATPENPVIVSTPPTVPPPVPGSMHKEDWSALIATAVQAAMAAKAAKEPPKK